MYPEDGKIWDMYSTKALAYRQPALRKLQERRRLLQPANTHSPKSWFNEGKPMYSDAFHLYPTDGKVNGQRSNYPALANVPAALISALTMALRLSVVAVPALFSGYSGRVFEPDDEYKGDFARSYFYMAAAYNNKNQQLVKRYAGKNNYPVFTSWVQ